MDYGESQLEEPRTKEPQAEAARTPEPRNRRRKLVRSDHISDHTQASTGTQSIERAIALLMLVGRAGLSGARPSDLVLSSGLPKPTARRVLLALMRAGLIEQDPDTRRYHVGPEAFILGARAASRFSLHSLALAGLARLARESGDTAFLSVPRECHAVCLHREEGPYPIRTHVLQVADRHPLGIGAGSLAILASYPDDEIERILAHNRPELEARYPSFSPDSLRALVADTRQRGYALNPGLVMPNSWGIGLAVPGPDHRAVGALSIAAIEPRLSPARQAELTLLLRREVTLLQDALADPAISSRSGRASARPSHKVKP